MMHVEALQWPSCIFTGRPRANCQQLYELGRCKRCRRARPPDPGAEEKTQPRASHGETRRRGRREATTRSLYLSIYLSISLSLSIYMCIYICIYIYICVSLSLSLYIHQQDKSLGILREYGKHVVAQCGRRRKRL